MASFSSSLVAENALTGRQSVIEELVHGRGLATQLRALLSKTDLNEDDDDYGSIRAEDLLSEIMTSFTNTLLMLNKNDNITNENDGRFFVDSQFLDYQAPKSEDSEESCRSVSTVVVAKKDRRGCYKRRKTSNSWKRDTPTLIDDGHAWRKYGQKDILKAKYPRNYFRCTHRLDQKCLSTKHVQRIQEEPQMYRTTYYGNHTCRNLLSTPELVLDCHSPTQNNSSNSMLLSFNLDSTQSRNPFLSSFISSSTISATTSAIKQELRDDNEIVATTPYCNNNIITANSQSSDHYNTILTDHHDVQGFDHGQSMLSSNNFESHHEIHEDVISEVMIDMEAFEDDVLQHLDFN